jgi:hypothetical protein
MKLRAWRRRTSANTARGFFRATTLMPCLMFRLGIIKFSGHISRAQAILQVLVRPVGHSAGCTGVRCSPRRRVRVHLAGCLCRRAHALTASRWLRSPMFGARMRDRPRCCCAGSVCTQGIPRGRSGRCCAGTRNCPRPRRRRGRATAAPRRRRRRPVRRCRRWPPTT